MLEQTDDINELFTEIATVVKNEVSRKVPAEDVDDVTQYVCLHVWQSLDSFQGKSLLMTWVKTIARNRISQWYRHQEVVKKHNLRAQEWQRQFPIVTEDKNSRWDQLNMDAAVDKLVDSQRHVILEMLDDNKVADIAKADHVPYETTRSTYRRAKRNLRVRVAP